MSLLESSPSNAVKTSRFKQAQFLADVLLLLVAIIWGSTYITAKTVVSVYPVFLFLFVRFALTTVMMTPFLLRNRRGQTRQFWRVGLILGIFLFLIYGFETVGIAHTSASNAAFLISLCVVLTPIVEGVVSRKNPGLSMMGVVLLSVIGTGLLTLKQGYHFNVGDLLILGAALMRAIQMTFTQKLTAQQDFDSGALTAIQMAAVTVLMGACSLMTESHAYSTVHTSAEFWLITVYLAVFGTMFAFYVQMTMIRRTSPVRVGLLLGTEPLFGAIFAVLFGGEALSGFGLLGGACIVAATYWGRHLETRSR